MNTAPDLSTIISIANGFKSEAYANEIAKLERNGQMSTQKDRFCYLVALCRYEALAAFDKKCSEDPSEIEKAIVTVGFGMLGARKKAETLKSTINLRDFIRGATQPETAVFQKLVKEATADV